MCVEDAMWTTKVMTSTDISFPVLRPLHETEKEAISFSVSATICHKRVPSTLFLAALILVGGPLGDHFGRIFAPGISLFTIPSVLCDLAPVIILLICARAVHGISGASRSHSSLVFAWSCRSLSG
jgi:hypothetical protein